MNNNKKKSMNPKSSLIFRLVAGMYLIYLAYQLFTGLNTDGGAPIGVAIGVAVIFVVCGGVLVFNSGRDFLKGNYQGGIMDVAEEDTSENT